MAIKFDLKKFRESESCISVYFRPRVYLSGGMIGPQFCAQGKFGLATGLINEKMERWQITDAIRGFIHHNRCHQVFQDVADLNNEGRFKEADAIILTWAMESGKFEFINGLNDDQEKLKACQSPLAQELNSLLGKTGTATNAPKAGPTTRPNIPTEKVPARLTMPLEWLTSMMATSAKK